jgi:hypothetical protein
MNTCCNYSEIKMRRPCLRTAMRHQGRLIGPAEAVTCLKTHLRK